MASTVDKDVKWPAAKVRDTFLEYFQKNGHTFGIYIKIDIAQGRYTDYYKSLRLRSYRSLTQLCFSPMLV